MSRTITKTKNAFTAPVTHSYARGLLIRLSPTRSTRLCLRCKTTTVPWSGRSWPDHITSPWGVIGALALSVDVAFAAALARQGVVFLRRVDAMQADSLAMDFERVAVDYGGSARYVGQGWGGKQAQGNGEGAHGHMVPRLGEKE